ncbi:ABC transporter permease [Algihabitans albus]|uniref:ABC transporter permease n=1 Tax=Algihabitans albus TaxID=2164067 RepID=UPI000E5D63D8|nr:ABC transporter permease [Algihabitans albus]
MAQIAIGDAGKPERLTTADGTPLKQALGRVEFRAKTRAFLLVAPLLVFLSITFLFPIGQMLFRSLHDPLVSGVLPNTLATLEDWSAEDGLPPEEAFAALAQELALARENRFSGDLGRVATRLNYEKPGIRSAVTRTARSAARMEAPFKEAMIEADADWGKLESWATIQRLGNVYNAVQYLAAVDRRYNEFGDIVMQAEQRQIYVQLFGRTLWMSLLVTSMALLLGFPISYLLATQPTRVSNVLMILVLLPFWTSLLVRTTSWIVLLQSEGVLNDILVWIGLVGDNDRIQMIYNQTGTVIAMTQILLPFMVLPLFSVMKTISPSHMRAAQSLGAPRFQAFWKVYAPQTLPGVGAGCLLVFILAIGYYITPALVGGQDGQMISNFIAFHMQSSLNWGLAAALGGILLAGVLALYWLYNKLVGVERLTLG